MALAFPERPPPTLLSKNRLKPAAAARHTAAALINHGSLLGTSGLHLGPVCARGKLRGPFSTSWAQVRAQRGAVKRSQTRRGKLFLASAAHRASFHCSYLAARAL